MTLTAQEAWTRLLERARQELPEQTFKTWLEPTEPLKIEGDKLFIETARGPSLVFPGKTSFGRLVFERDK